ncbi:MAG: nucleotidyltransferase family protein [Elusimicrobia bacterium]|nr:nucleotidyltransferase family protein [Elusimicrobiota bacterium]
MDFAATVRALGAVFEDKGIRYALMGGAALGVWGYPRQTMDLDFLVNRDDLPSLDEALTAIGYKRVFQNENVSHYVGALAAQGGVDFIHAFRKVSLGMLERAVVRPVFGGSVPLRVLQAEDVIGLKVQAMANNPARAAREAADIETLARVNGPRLDWSRIGEFFALFGRDGEFEELRRRFQGGSA